MPVKFRAEITRSAEKDIEEIWSYIAADSPIKANRFTRALEQQVSALETFPQRCPEIPENALLGTSYRHLLHGSYRTVFRIDGRTVYVLRVIHGSRLLDASFLET